MKIILTKTDEHGDETDHRSFWLTDISFLDDPAIEDEDDGSDGAPADLVALFQ